MGKREVLVNIRHMTIAEKLARLSAADTAHVRKCIEQAVQEPAAEAAGFANDGSRGSPPVEQGRNQAGKQLNLTRREEEIFTMLLSGKVPKEIASVLKVSYETVRFHNKNLYRKLGISNRAELFDRYMTDLVGKPEQPTQKTTQPTQFYP